MKKQIKKQWMGFIVMVFWAISGCAGGNNTSENETPVSLSLKMPEVQNVAFSTQEKPASDEVGSVRVRVEVQDAPDALANKIQDVVSGEGIQMTLNLKPGPARTFIVEAFSGSSAEGALLFRGQETVDIVAGEGINVVINMLSLNFSLSPQSAILNVSQTQVFSVEGFSPEAITWGVQGSEGPIDLGRIDVGGTYEAPAILPIDTSKTALGIPVEITVTAETTEDRDQARIKVVTGPSLAFASNSQISPQDQGSARTSNQSAGQRSIVFVDGKVTVVWARRHPNNQASEVTAVFSESTDGETWNAPQPIIGIPRSSQGEVSIAAAPDGTLYAAFLDCTRSGCGSDSNFLSLAKKGKGESTFVEMTGIDNAAGLEPHSPSVAIAPNGLVFLAWSVRRPRSFPNEGSSYDIVLQRFAANGSALDVNAKVISAQPGEETESVLSIAKTGEVYLAWVLDVIDTQLQSFPKDIMVAVLRNGKDKFDVPVRVDDNEPVSEGALKNYDDDQLSIAAGPSGTVYVAWRNETCGDTCYEVAFDKGTLSPSGLTFGADIAFPSEGGAFDQYTPSVAWDETRGIYVAYEEFYRLSSMSINRIFLAKSVNDGATFSRPVQIDGANDDNVRADVSIAVDAAGRVFASWADYRGGQFPDYLWFAKGLDDTGK